VPGPWPSGPSPLPFPPPLPAGCVVPAGFAAGTAVEVDVDVVVVGAADAEVVEGAAVITTASSVAGVATIWRATVEPASASTGATTGFGRAGCAIGVTPGVTPDGSFGTVLPALGGTANGAVTFETPPSAMAISASATSTAPTPVMNETSRRRRLLKAPCCTDLLPTPPRMPPHLWLWPVVYRRDRARP
jgi:hypothetical protein